MAHINGRHRDVPQLRDEQGGSGVTGTSSVATKCSERGPRGSQSESESVECIEPSARQ